MANTKRWCYGLMMFTPIFNPVLFLKELRYESDHTASGDVHQIGGRGELWDTCGDDDLVEQLDKVSRELEKSSRKLATMETEARNHRHTAKYEREQAKFAEKKPDAEQHSKDAAVFDDNARQLEVKLPALRQHVAELEKQERDIREKMLVP